ncbi:1-acylglycerol-3-phosphate O-acyltransferase 6 (lysophosphatidic acid acyltransferase, zeta), partial [Nowakowskiella sp. JEL0078]
LDVPHVFVSNHTSFVDWIVLSAHNFPHATIAQKQGGLFGFFLESVLKLNGTLQFNRNERSDRALISKKIRDHVHDPSKTPLHIFPEGTCVNNEYTVLFHKGAFELDAIVCPVAVKYNKRWADAYWHSKNESFSQHILYLMSRWAFVADVWYLPPMLKLEHETPSDFANRVKELISRQARLRNLSWDGYFKNYAPAKDKAIKMQAQPQQRFYNVLMIRDQTKLGRLRRSNSVCYGDLSNVHVKFEHLNLLFDNKQDSMNEMNTDLKNQILQVAEDNDPRMDMIRAISDKKNDVVETWKKYSKLRSPDFEQRRVENSSWRLWFKRRIEDQQRKQEIDELKRRSSKLSLTDSYFDDGIAETISAKVSSLWGDVAATLSRNNSVRAPSTARSVAGSSNGSRSRSMDALYSYGLAQLTPILPGIKKPATGSSDEVEVESPVSESSFEDEAEVSPNHINNEISQLSVMVSG